jgi:hypothetical protein
MFEPDKPVNYSSQEQAYQDSLRSFEECNILTLEFSNRSGNLSNGLTRSVMRFDGDDLVELDIIKKHIRAALSEIKQRS